MPGEKVLIIDDSSELRSLLESILPYAGYEAISASTGQEGLELVPEVKPDVILVDLELPDTTGLKVLEELKQQKLPIPTIMMTGYGSEGVAARALRLGVQGYLIKPFTTEEVLSTIEKALSLGRLHREQDQLATLLESYARHFKMVSAIGHCVVTEPNLDEILERIVEAGLFITRAEACLLLLSHETTHQPAALTPQQTDKAVSAAPIGGHPSQLRVAAAKGEGSDAIETVAALAGDERLWTVLQEAAVVRLHAAPGSKIQLQTGCPVRAVVQAPLKRQGQVIGLLSVARQERGAPFGKHDEQIVTILADYASLALERGHRAEAS